MRAVEKYYTVADAALLLALHPKTVIDRLKAKEFGEGVADLAAPASEGRKQAHDYRIPASGLNAYLDQRRVFLPTGIPARTHGELRRKSERLE